MPERSDDVALHFRRRRGPFRRRRLHGMEVWLTKLETHLEQHSLAETQRLLADRGMTLAAAAYQGGLLLSQGEQRRRITIISASGSTCARASAYPRCWSSPTSPGPSTPRRSARSVVSLTQAAQWAAGFGVTLGLEFRGRSSFCTSLDTALALVEECGEPNVGVNLDVFHYYIGPSKFDDLDLLTPARLAHVQLCDLAGVPASWRTTATACSPATATSGWGRCSTACGRSAMRVGFPSS